MLVLVDEFKPNAIKEANRLKTFLAGDDTSCAKKHAKDIELRCRCLCIFLTNDYPEFLFEHCPGYIKGFRERIIPICADVDSDGVAAAKINAQLPANPSTSIPRLSGLCLTGPRKSTRSPLSPAGAPSLISTAYSDTSYMTSAMTNEMAKERERRKKAKKQMKRKEAEAIRQMEENIMKAKAEYNQRKRKKKYI
jgi:hypothetical protein